MTLEVLPLLNDRFWNQLPDACVVDKFRILSALPLHLQALIEGGLERHRPKAGLHKIKLKEEQMVSAMEAIPASQSLLLFLGTSGLWS